MTTQTLDRTATVPGRKAPIPTATPDGGPWAWLNHSLVLAKRSLINTWRTPEALIDVTLQPVIFLGLFTYIFGGAISGGSQQEYLNFLLPGMLGQLIGMSSISVGQSLNADIEKGVFDRFRALPIARSAPLVGGVLADVVRYLILFTCTMGTGLLMGFRPNTDALHVLAALVLAMGFALCFCWVAVWVGMKVRTPGAVQGVMFLLVMPLSFGSSAFVDPSTMPGWLQGFANNNPLSHLAGATRSLMMGTPMGNHLTMTFVWMAGLLVVFFPLALRAYKRRA